MNLSVSGEIPLTSWFAKKPAQPRAKQRPIKRRPINSQLDSSPPVKKSKSSISSSSKLDESDPSFSKKTSIMNYLQGQPSRRAQVPHTPQLKSLTRTDACLPTPPDSARPAIKPRRAIPALIARHDTLVEDDTIFTARPDSRPSTSFSPATSSASSEVIELSDSEDPDDDLYIPSSQSQEMCGAPIPSPDDFVGSSQSQLLDVWENPSPRKNKRLRNAIPVEPTLESIPSSQSQEWDLGTAYHHVEARFESTKTVTQLRNKHLFGSFDDISASNNCIDDMCVELDTMASERASRANKGGACRDSQDLGVDQHSKASLDRSCGDDIQTISQPVPCLLAFVADHATIYDISPSPPSRSPRQVADYQDSLPAESLPDEVKDFLDMFGGGSYPPDFPESLKD